MHRFAADHQDAKRAVLVAVHILACHVRRQKGHGNAVFSIVSGNRVNVLAYLFRDKVQRHPQRQTDHDIIDRRDKHQTRETAILIVAP